MSIDSEVTSMTQNIQADYEGLENLGADLTGINKNILNIRTILDNIYNDMPKVTGEGTEVTLTSTRKGRLALIPKGNSTQESTTGKNLFIPTLTNGGNEIYHNNCNVSLTSDEFVFVATGTDMHFGNVVANGSSYSNSTGVKINVAGKTNVYVLIENTEFNKSYISFFDNNNISLGRSPEQTSNTFNLSLPSGTEFVTLRLGKGNSVSGTTYKTRIMVSTSEITSYEQYTGGIPAPNPSYPFPIKSVTGNNNVVARTPNLLGLINGTYKDASNETTCVVDNGKITMNGTTTGIRTIQIPISNTLERAVGESFTISANNPVANSDILIRMNDNGTYDLTLNSINKTTTRTIVENRPIYTNKIVIRVASGTTLSNFILQPMLEYGSTAHNYQPYGNQTKPLNLGTIELNGINTYKNLIFKAVNGDLYYDSLTSEQKALLTYGARYYHEEIGKYVVTEETPIYYTSGYFYVRKSDLPKAQMSNTQALSNYFKYQATNNPSGTFRTGNDYAFQFFTNYTEVSQFTTWLSTHNTIVVYILATPTDIEITDTQLIEQLNEIEKMQGYNGTTIITSTYDSNNAQMIISASALKGE